MSSRASGVSTKTQGVASVGAGAIGAAKKLLRQSLSNSLEQQLELEGASIAAQLGNPLTIAALERFFATRGRSR